MNQIFHLSEIFLPPLSLSLSLSLSLCLPLSVSLALSLSSRSKTERYTFTVQILRHISRNNRANSLIISTKRHQSIDQSIYQSIDQTEDKHERDDLLIVCSAIETTILMKGLFCSVSNHYLLKTYAWLLFV